MQWEQILALIIGNLAIILPLWLWTRSEARADARQIHQDITQDRRDFIQFVRGIEHSIKNMELDNRDFHHRLLEIERSRK